MKRSIFFLFFAARAGILAAMQQIIMYPMPSPTHEHVTFVLSCLILKSCHATCSPRYPPYLIHLCLVVFPALDSFQLCSLAKSV